jgi:hypothetical protein
MTSGRNCRTTPASASGCRFVEALDSEAEGAQQVVPALGERTAGLPAGFAPVGPLARPRTQLARNHSLRSPASSVPQRRQDIAQRPQRGMPVGLLERLAADPLDLATIEGKIGGRIVPRGATERDPIRVQHDEEERRRPASVSLRDKIMPWTSLSIIFGRAP